MLRGLSGALAEALAPRRCAACEAVSSVPICAGCAGVLAGLPLPPPREVPTGTAVAAWEFAGPVRAAIHRGKYLGDRAALRALTALARRRLADRLPAAAGGLVVPVPAGRRRRAQRGYNQAELIAVELAPSGGVTDLGSLVRVRDTPPQADLDEAARRANVADAFAWRGPSLAGARLRLVDDVYTTGATAGAAATALAAAGAQRVDVLVLATVL